MWRGSARKELDRVINEFMPRSGPTARAAAHTPEGSRIPRQMVQMYQARIEAVRVAKDVASAMGMQRALNELHSVEYACTMLLIAWRNELPPQERHVIDP